MKGLLLRGINKNQLLIMKELDNNHSSNITALLTVVSKLNNISLSTLKFNSKLLRKLGLISFGNGNRAELTDFGRYIFRIIGCDEDG